MCNSIEAEAKGKVVEAQEAVKAAKALDTHLDSLLLDSRLNEDTLRRCHVYRS